MPCARQRRHQDPEPRRADAPAEVESFELGVEAFVEEAGALPGFAGDQHGGRGHAEDLEHAVELALVDLVGLQRSVRVTEQVRGHPHVAQAAGLLPVDHLGAHDTDAIDTDPDGGFHQPLDHIGVHGGVVMEQQHEVGFGRDRELEGGLQRTGEAPRFGERDDPTFPQRLFEELT